jgi:hypothetical protein
MLQSQASEAGLGRVAEIDDFTPGTEEFSGDCVGKLLTGSLANRR